MMNDRLQRWFSPLRVNLWERGDLFGLLILLVLLLAPALAFRTAQWPLEMRTIVPTIFFSLVFGYVLAKSRASELFALVLALLYGVVMVIGIAGFNQRSDPITGIFAVMTRTIEWLYDALTGGINQDEVVFTLLGAAVFWYMGFNATWHTFRMNKPWRAIMLPALILVTNMALYSGRNALDLYLSVFILMALLLLIRSSVESRELSWMVNGIRVPVHVRPQLLRMGIVLAVVCTLAAWVVPRNDVQERVSNFQSFLQSATFSQFSDFFNRLFTPVEAEGPATADYYGSELLSLTGAIRLSDQPMLSVRVDAERGRWYWRSRVFERYDTGQWSPSSLWRVSDANAPIDFILSEEFIGQKRVTVNQTFTITNAGARLIYTAPQPQQVGTAGRVDLVRLDESLGDASPVNVSVIRPLRVLEQGSTYSAVSLMSDATADDLRSAGTTYPEWVTNPNTFVGISVSQRIVQLAQSIVANAGATTPYDQAKAIELWLRANIRYNEKIPAPPVGRDPIEWFVFDMQEGYCTYYATTMAIMLRSLNIPARMAAGFSQGDFDATTGQYIVRERDAHTWVEVFFPGYGWIEFEPTSSEEPLTRPGDNTPPPAPTENVDAPTALPSQTPTLLPSPTALPSLTPTPTIERQLQENDPITATPTPSPTPTPTAVVVPTIAPPVQPPEIQQPPDFLQVLLRALGIAALIIAIVVSFVLVGTLVWWWWEWRGMGGLSPVARAYKRLERYVPLAGVLLTQEETPEEKRRKVVNELPDAEKPVTYIARTYIRERFSPPRSGDPELNSEVTNSEKAWLDARRTILRAYLARWNPFRRRKP